MGATSRAGHRKWRMWLAAGLTVATAILTVVSYRRPLCWERQLGPTTWVRVEVSEAWISLWHVDTSGPRGPLLLKAFRCIPESRFHRSWRPPWRSRGFGWRVNTPVLPEDAWGGSFRCLHSWVGIPVVAIWAVVVAVPALIFLRGGLRRLRRRRRGLCVACGYNLRGLTERRCPECGCSFREGEASV